MAGLQEVLFGNTGVKNMLHYVLTMSIKKIERVEATTFLGVVIDESLNFNNHISLVKSKLAKVASVLIFKVSHYIDKCSRHTLYCSLFTVQK